MHLELQHGNWRCEAKLERRDPPSIQTRQADRRRMRIFSRYRSFEPIRFSALQLVSTSPMPADDTACPTGASKASRNLVAITAQSKTRLAPNPHPIAVPSCEFCTTNWSDKLERRDKLRWTQLRISPCSGHR
ncbi:hypothetical protein M758_5G115700 [Ceratodon purpureus]|nr:hypothetical protein M758_5G115700 [Ceratodon purpureus]